MTSTDCVRTSTGCLRTRTGYVRIRTCCVRTRTGCARTITGGVKASTDCVRMGMQGLLTDGQKQRKNKQRLGLDKHTAYEHGQAA
jgi:hypothetical protein